MTTLLVTPDTTAHTDRPWWHDAVIYQVYPRSFYSTSGKYGTLAGVIEKIPHFVKLGIDAIWLSPFYTSPQKDAGYDVADYYNVDPRFGDIKDAQALIKNAHTHQLKVIVDLVPNHTSDQHNWFQTALAAGPESPERARYWFAPGKTPNDPPNGWRSVFGGSAWTKVSDRPDAPGSPWENDTSWYLHLFDSSQPDLNWQNTEVRKEFTNVLRYWLALGVDGFRIDVAHGMIKDPSLREWDYEWQMAAGNNDAGIPPAPMWNQTGVHEIYREWNQVLSQAAGEQMLVAEAWVEPLSELAKYLRPDEMQQAFNFSFLSSPFSASAYRKVIAQTITELKQVDAPPTWVLSNHDVVRASSRFGLTDTAKVANSGVGPQHEQPDIALGALRAKAAHMLQSALPGSCYIYQGEELSLPEDTLLAPQYRQDPTFFRTQGSEIGRDGCRIPLPWDANLPHYGFTPHEKPWLPQPANWEKYCATQQYADPDSSFNFFSRMYKLRKTLALGLGSIEDLSQADEIHFCNTRPVSYQLPALHIVVAFDSPVTLPSNKEVLLSTQIEVGEVLHPNNAIWYYQL